jgi:hypothetical protein
MQDAISSPDAHFIMLIASNILVSAAIIYQLKREGVFSFLSAALISNVLVYIFFCYEFYRHGSNLSYNAYKGALSLSFIIYIFMARFIEERLGRFMDGVRNLWRLHKTSAILKIPKERGFIIALIFCIFFYMNLCGMYKNLAPLFTNPVGAVGNEHSSLRAFSDSPNYEDSDFILSCDSILLQLAAEYFTPYGRTYMSGYSGLEGFSRRVMKESLKPGDIYVTATMTQNTIETTNAGSLFINDIYSVFQLDDESLMLYDYRGLYHAVDFFSTDGEEMVVKRINNNNVALMLFAMKPKPAGLSMRFLDLRREDQRSAKVSSNGEFFGEFKVKDGYIDVVLTDIPLREGINEITLKFDGNVKGVALAGLNFH